MILAVALLTLLIPLAPLLACLFSLGNILASSRVRPHQAAVIGCGVSCLSSLAVAVFIADPGRLMQQPLELYRWAALSGDLPFRVSFGLQADGLSALLLVTVTFVATLIAVDAVGSMRQEPANHRFFASLSLVLFATTMVILSSNFLELLFFWQLAGVGGYFLTDLRFDSQQTASAARKIFLVNRIADAALLSALFFIWVNFGSLEFADVLGNSAKLVDVTNRNWAAAGMICFCLIAACVGRCAQFPLFGWMHDSCQSPGTVLALLQSATTLPVAIYLLARCTPLFEAAPEAQSTMAFLGAFTALLAAAVAVAANDVKQVLGYTTVGLFGLMFVGLGTGSSLGVAGALFCLISHSLVKAALFLATNRVTDHAAGSTKFADLGGLRGDLPMCYWTFLLGGLILVSGFWGQHSILDAVSDASLTAHVDGSNVSQSQAETGQPPSPFGFEPSRLMRIVLWLSAASLLLTALAIFRAFFLVFHHDESGSGGSTSIAEKSIPMISLLVTVGVVGLAFAGPAKFLQRYLSHSWPGNAVTEDVELFATGSGFLLVLLGIVCAWMLYSKPSPWPAKLAEVFGPFARLSRHRFYVDEFYCFAVVMPLRGLAQVCRFVEWFVVDGLTAGLPIRLTRMFANSSRPLRNGLVQFYALSLMLTVAVLLTVLLCLQE